jgi:hypothetical protein
MAALVCVIKGGKATDVFAPCESRLVAWRI